MTNKLLLNPKCLPIFGQEDCNSRRQWQKFQYFVFSPLVYWCIYRVIMVYNNARAHIICAYYTRALCFRFWQYTKAYCQIRVYQGCVSGFELYTNLDSITNKSGFDHKQIPTRLRIWISEKRNRVQLKTIPGPDPKPENTSKYFMI